jgi:hypothetical protein
VARAASRADGVLTQQVFDSAAWGDGKRAGASGGGKEKLHVRSRLLPYRRLRARPPPWGLAQYSSSPTARLGAAQTRSSVHSDAARRSTDDAAWRNTDGTAWHSTDEVIARRGRSTCADEAVARRGCLRLRGRSPLMPLSVEAKKASSRLWPHAAWCPSRTPPSSQRRGRRTVPRTPPCSICDANANAFFFWRWLLCVEECIYCSR